jgi:hypothetical protein
MEAVLTAFLAPLLPYLLRAGQQAAEEAGRRIGGDAWEHAKALWGRLRLSVEARPAAREAVADVEAAPDDVDAQAALRHQLKKLLGEDEALAQDVARLWKEAEAAGVTAVTVSASGERSIAVGRDASGIFITGDSNLT